MALYTPPSLPRTPSSCAMTTTLPSLSTDLLQSWSAWRPPKHQHHHQQHQQHAALITPPMSTTLPRIASHHAQVSLPPIAHFDRQVSKMPLLTPPTTHDASSWSKSAPGLAQSQAAYVSPRYSPPETRNDPPMQAPRPAVPQDPNAPVVDWFDFSLKRSAHFLAEKTCEMIVYLWFSNSLRSAVHRAKAEAQQTPSPPYSPDRQSSTPLQFSVTPSFVHFMQKLLETTQVSQSVIVLALLYIFRLKEKNHFTAGLPGSEFRIAVAALMMANKFLDDNTYTNKTWSDVSGISLDEVNRMEREFLLGINFGLYANKSEYDTWMNLLKGLVMAKEKEHQAWRGGPRTRHRAHRHAAPGSASTSTARHYRHRYQHPATHRARSTSPMHESPREYPPIRPFMPTAVPTPAVAPTPATLPAPVYLSTPAPAPQPGSKRSAADAFSPTSASFSQLPPLKRPTGMTLQIPDKVHALGPASNSPLESLQSFAKMSLSSSPHSVRTAHPALSAHSDNRPQTLVAAYRVDKPLNVPENLYYYSLAGSVTNTDQVQDQEQLRRKAKLRCYQPAPPPTSYPPPPPHIPMNIQSASVSPHEVHMNIRQALLPHLHDAVWSRKHLVPPVPVYNHSPVDVDGSLHLPPLRDASMSSIPSAPFANAGPPGVHGVQYYTPPNHASSPLYPYNWSYGR